MRIGLSYHGGDHEYDAYPQALHRRAHALGIAIETVWLAGTERETRLDLFEGLDGIVLTGGADVEPRRYGFADPQGLCKTKPERDAVEWEILERLQARPLPTLAICRGAQILNVFHGGSLIADLAGRNAVHRREGDEWREHGVRIAADSLLQRLAGITSGTVNSSHHQAVERLAEGFRVSAVSADGVVEAFEPSDFRTSFLLAVQWHPEAMAAGEALADPVLDALLHGLR